MKKLKKIKIVISVMMVICILSNTIVPVFAQGTTGAYFLVFENKTIELLKDPERNEMGLMVSAKEVLDTVDIKYEHDEELDSFEIFLEDGNIMLMHNATHYYKGEESIDCQPYFTVHDVPLIELGFLCQLIGREYEYFDTERKILIKSTETSDNEIEMTDFESITSKEETEDPPVTLYRENEIVLKSIPSSSTLSANYTLSGTISLPTVAPEGGINISLILENTKVVHDSLYGTNAYYYDAGSRYIVANINFAEGEKSKPYSIDVGDYQSPSFSEYVIFYETESNNLIDTKGYVKNNGTTHIASKLTTDGELRDNLDIKLFEHGNDIITNISITEKDMSCGENAFWSYDKTTKTLTISGTGDMYDFTWDNVAWSDYRKEIEKVIIENGITTIGDYAFYDCYSLTNIEIPDSVETIGDYAFCFCDNLTSIEIPDSVETIGDYAFYDCYSLTSIEIPDSVETIGDYAFYGCYGLTSIEIPDSVKTIGDGAFQYCYDLTSIEIPDSVETIGEYAFYACDGLTSVTIGNSVKTIGDYAFEGCYSLTCIRVDSNNPNYSSDDRGVLFNKNKTTLIQYPIGNAATSYTIPDSVKTIGDYAFLFCDNLTSIEIPDSVETIGDMAFYFCDGLTSITVDSNNPNYSSDDRGVLFNKNKTTLIQYPIGNDATLYIIPDSVTTIGDYAFEGCYSLTSVTIGNSVETIGERAFCFCDNLTSIEIPDSVKTIGDGAFQYCYDLTSIEIPDSVETIGESAFDGCDGLTSVTIGNGVKTIGNGAFFYCSSLTSIEIPDSVETIGSSAFKYCSDLKKVIIYSETVTIGSSNFKNCHANMTIYGYTESTTQTYAKENDIAFIPLNIVNGLLSGTISLPSAAPEDGINISLVLENTKTVSRSLYGTNAYYYDAGSQHIVANINFAEGEKSKPYSIDVGDYQSPSFSEYVIFYETEPNNLIDTKGYVKNNGTTHIASKLTTDGELRDNLDIKLFEHGNDIITNISITEKDMSCGENAFWSYDKKTKTLIISGTGDMYDFAWNNVAWSDYRKEIEKVVIKDGITSIGDYAFYDCYSLTNIEIPDSVETIGEATFSFCDDLTSIEIPDSVETIGSYVFYGCDELKKATIYNENVTIGSYSFKNCHANMTIYGYKNSTVKTYAEKNGITFIPLYEYDVCVSTEAKKIATQGSQFTYKVYFAGTYDGFSFEVVPCDGMNITSITTTNDNINVDEQTGKWLVSVIGGLEKNDSEKEEIVTVTVQVAEDAELGTRLLSLSNVMISDVGGDKVSNIKYDYASIEITDQLPGDINGDDEITDNDAIYLMYHTFFPEDYPINQECDFNGDGEVTDNDAIYLMYHTFFPEEYPLSYLNSE